MKTKQKTHVYFLLDETGSMGGIKKSVIDGFNSYITELKTDKNILFTLVKFDSRHYTLVCDAIKIRTVKQLNNESYTPDATTNLNDSIMRLIYNAKSKAEYNKIIFVIYTDGYENASVEHTSNDVYNEITKYRNKNWQFVFMGAGIDSYTQSNKYNIPRSHTISQAHGYGSTINLYKGLAENTRGFSSGGLSGMSFSMEQKLDVEDVYDITNENITKGDKQKENV